MGGSSNQNNAKVDPAGVPMIAYGRPAMLVC